MIKEGLKNRRQMIPVGSKQISAVKEMVKSYVQK
jgi:hypothetical protein